MEQKQTEEKRSMIEKLKDLHEKFFKLYEDLYLMTEFIPEEHKIQMAQKIFENYQTEYALLSMKEQIKTEEELFVAGERIGMMRPRRWRKLLFFKRENKAATLFGEQARLEAIQHFNEIEQRLTEMRARLEKTAGEIPAETSETALSEEQRQEGEEMPKAGQEAVEEGNKGIDDHLIIT